MDFIYSISAQRGQKAPELFYLTHSYEKAIIFLYEYILKDNGKDMTDDYSFYTDFYQLNKFPLDFNFAPGDDTWSNVKMTKSSKYRVKFKNFGELKKEYLPIKRNEKLEKVLGE